MTDQTGSGDSRQSNGHSSNPQIEKTFEPHIADDETGQRIWLEKSGISGDVEMPSRDPKEELGIEDDEDGEDDSKSTDPKR